MSEELHAKAIPLASAAPMFGVSAETLRRWVREEGCPAIAGGRGRGGKGYRVEVDAVRAWRAGKAAHDREAQLRDLAGLALDFFRRGAEIDFSGQRLLGIRDCSAAALLVFFFDYVVLRFIGGELDTPETKLLAEIARQGFGIVHAVHDSVKDIERSSKKDQPC